MSNRHGISYKSCLEVEVDTDWREGDKIIVVCPAGDDGSTDAIVWPLGSLGELEERVWRRSDMVTAAFRSTGFAVGLFFVLVVTLHT